MLCIDTFNLIKYVRQLWLGQSFETCHCYHSGNYLSRQESMGLIHLKYVNVKFSITIHFVSSVALSFQLLEKSFETKGKCEALNPWTSLIDYMISICVSLHSVLDKTFNKFLMSFQRHHSENRKQ